MQNYWPCIAPVPERAVWASEFAGSSHTWKWGAIRRYLAADRLGWGQGGGFWHSSHGGDFYFPPPSLLTSTGHGNFGKLTPPTWGRRGNEPDANEPGGGYGERPSPEGLEIPKCIPFSDTQSSLFRPLPPTQSGIGKPPKPRFINWAPAVRGQGGGYYLSKLLKVNIAQKTCFTRTQGPRT